VRRAFADANFAHNQQAAFLMQILPTLAGFQRKRELQKEKKFQNKDTFTPKFF